MSVPVIDARTSQPYNIKTHTISEAYNSEEFIGIRKNLRNGIQDKNCDHCWRQENRDGRSLRLESIDEYQEVFKSGKTSGLITMQLDLSNQCNLKCRTCNHSDSSMWAKEYFDLNEQHSNITFSEFQKIYNYTLHKEDVFFEDIKKNVLPSLAIIRFQGGEPFLMKRQWAIVDSIIESCLSKDILLGYHTNGTIWNDTIEDKLSKFKEVNLCLSIDDVGSRFEYLRHPGNWLEVNSNIEKIIKWSSIDKDARDILINCVVTPYNLLTLCDLIDYCVSNNIALKLHPTDSPEHFSIANIPTNLKQVFIDKLRSKTYSAEYASEVENVISVLLGSGSSEQWKMFLKTTKIHDQYRNEDFEKTFPELVEVLKHDK
jgi:MoaA/NifB/PqqE/SkfB family radical SAM enzyme